MCGYTLYCISVHATVWKVSIIQKERQNQETGNRHGVEKRKRKKGKRKEKKPIDVLKKLQGERRELCTTEEMDSAIPALETQQLM